MYVNVPALLSKLVICPPFAASETENVNESPASSSVACNVMGTGVSWFVVTCTLDTTGELFTGLFAVSWFVVVGAVAASSALDATGGLFAVAELSIACGGELEFVVDSDAGDASNEEEEEGDDVIDG